MSHVTLAINLLLWLAVAGLAFIAASRGRILLNTGAREGATTRLRMRGSFIRTGSCYAQTATQGELREFIDCRRCELGQKYNLPHRTSGQC